MSEAQHIRANVFGKWLEGVESMSQAEINGVTYVNVTTVSDEVVTAFDAPSHMVVKVPWATYRGTVAQMHSSIVEGRIWTAYTMEVVMMTNKPEVE